MRGRSGAVGEPTSRRPATGEGFADPQPETLEEVWNPVWLHLEAVALSELREGFRIGLGDAAHLDELLEEALESGRRDDLEDPARLVARVPERVPLVAWLEDQVARPGLNDVITEQRADPPLQ